MKKAQVLALIITVILIVLLFNLDITHKKEQETKGSDSKIQLAIEKVKGQNPMEGIMMLTEIVDTEPENVEALFYLGMFSIESGQFEKAIVRFQSILSIDSSFIIAHRYLGESLLAIGDTIGALNELEKYVLVERDNENKQEINILINKLN